METELMVRCMFGAMCGFVGGQILYIVLLATGILDKMYDKYDKWSDKRKLKKQVTKGGETDET